ncbi:Serine/arginine-rich splicing factor 4 [Zancudomyces culisetae]|uniref:Serine/arginine-rich splicing factor 4 n=1 Tax=Zancudomyces culisetae TaxID=1213189 RepID=A0A1R1PYK9_ZANCU|nr:Serine/arginine-rich splicing factor 4 [Zancudomyces culisetae]|eukprot:OMH85999.1 Serine/arginine-rich splicing factor 4 [Zancudomyces culisetae]
MSRVYIGNLPDDAREKDIERFFRGYGEIRQMDLRAGFGFLEFRERRDAEDAIHDLDGKDLMGARVSIQRARQEGRRFEADDRRGRYGRDDRYERRGEGRYGGDRDRRRGRSRSRSRDRFRRLDRGAGRGGGLQRTKYRILVENLSSSVSWQDLKDFMRRAGDVVFTDAHKIRQGEGVVEFSDLESMENALRRLDGEDLKGRRIAIRPDRGAERDRERRDGSRSPPNNRSRSPRRENEPASPRENRQRSPSPASNRNDNPDNTSSWGNKDSYPPANNNDSTNNAETFGNNWASDEPPKSPILRDD